MLPLVRNLPSSSRSCLGAAGARRLASTSASSKELFRNYKTWKEDTGLQYKDARPQNWLGDDRPFPLNTTFKPPAPISDELKDVIYAKFMENPADNGVRQLASLYGLSIKRVDAILRLKGLEQHWKQGKQLQTGFQEGMEELLAVKKESITRLSDSLGEDTIAADSQADESGNDAARMRYQRMFWEPTPENNSPIVPELLETLREQNAIRHTASKPAQVRVLERKGRANIHFVDVGDQFVNKKAEQKRLRQAERRSVLRARRQGRNVQEETPAQIPSTA
ncbi:eukaryotic mitochondrial regulator protein-domain-containing protein, partial [Irpex rosettiformis]